MQRTDLLPHPEHGARRGVLHHCDYFDFIVRDYEARYNGRRLLKGSPTLMWVREDRGKEGGAAEAAGIVEQKPIQVPDSIPHLKEAAGE